MQTLNLDLSAKAIIPPLYAKQGDVGRKFKVILTDGGVAYPVPDGAAVSVWYSGASGEGNYTDIGAESAVAVSGNEITVELITQMLTNPGAGVVCLVINAADGDELGTWNINYCVESRPGMNSEAAQAYFTAFSQAVANLPYPDASLTIAGKAADAAAVGTALAGKAPAGYGLGGNASACPNSDCNQAVYSGWYTVSGSSTANGPGENGVMLVSRRNSSCIWQYHFSYSANPSVRRRTCISDVWSQWEWVNPPMEVGVEYRTTERWNGKAVYTKCCPLGNLPNATQKTVGALVDDNIGMLVNADVVVCSDAWSYINHPSVTCYVANEYGSRYAVLTTNTDMSAYTAYLLLKYTKA